MTTAPAVFGGFFGEMSRPYDNDQSPDEWLLSIA
jgi:hypothetical protein